MPDYQNCYIAFLDLLGFKNLINCKSCQDIMGYFAEIETEYIITDNIMGQPLIQPAAIKKKIMSDSICFYVDADIKNSLAGLVAVCDYFQVRMLRLQEPILCRGAIVKGNIYANGDITFGPGVTNAYLLEEQVANTPRIIIAKSVIDGWGNYDAGGKNYIKEYLFRDTDDFFVLDYLFLFYGLSHDQDSWKNFAKYVVERLDHELNPKIREKYLYIKRQFSRVTKKYMDYIEEHKDA